MELSFETYDVFTDTPYKGNPLAIVTIPANTPKPTQDQKQAIASEFNLSETIFIHDVADPASETSRNVDIFIPVTEINFAGHPTIGAAVSLLPKGVTTIVTRAGPIPVRKTGPSSAQASIPHNVHAHKKRLRDVPGIESAALSATRLIRDAELSAPVFSIVKGMTFILVELPSLETLGQVQQTSFSPPTEQLLDPEWQSGLACMYYFVRTGVSGGENGVPVVKLRTRMVLPLFEDPATGSAASALTSYLSRVNKEQTTPVCRYEITQGVEMGRESNIVVEITLKDDEIDTVHLSGNAVKVMQGTLTV